jgi:TrmH family RNA methyltransferase
MTRDNYQEITSPQNNQLKLLGKLDSKKDRQEAGLFLVENLAIIIDALKAGYDFEALFVTQEFLDKHGEQIDYLQDNSKSRDFFLINSKLNKLYSSLDTPSGITALYKIKSGELDKSSVVYLNGISDPGNLGTIMRSALAFDFNNLVLDRNCVDIYNPKVISAAKDAIFKLNIIEDKDGQWIKQTKLPVYAANSDAGTDLEKIKPAKTFCLVLGSESHGISEEIIKSVDKNIKIDISDKIESLNVAAAAAILFYKFKQ